MRGLCFTFSPTRETCIFLPEQHLIVCTVQSFARQCFTYFAQSVICIQAQRINKEIYSIKLPTCIEVLISCVWKPHSEPSRVRTPTKVEVNLVLQRQRQPDSPGFSRRLDQPEVKIDLDTQADFIKSRPLKLSYRGESVSARETFYESSDKSRCFNRFLVSESIFQSRCSGNNFLPRPTGYSGARIFSLPLFNGTSRRSKGLWYGNEKLPQQHRLVTGGHTADFATVRQQCTRRSKSLWYGNEKLLQQQSVYF